MEDDNRATKTIKVLGLSKWSSKSIDSPRSLQGYLLFGRNGEIISAPNLIAANLHWHVIDSMDCVQAQVEYKDEKKEEFNIREIEFFGPSDKMRTLVEIIGFGAV